MKNLLLIKLGGSLITDKGIEYTAKPEVIRRLAKEIKSAQKKFKGKIIVAHGSGSFGHFAAARYGTDPKGLPLIADAAITINRIVMKGFLKEKVAAISFAPASLIWAEKKKAKKMLIEPIMAALNLGYLPILYGDIVFENKKTGIFSSETTLGLLALKLKIDFKKVRQIYCGNTDGVYGADGKTIKMITPKEAEKMKQFVTGSDKTDVTGGMLHKIEESFILARAEIETLIVNGNTKGELKRAILGKKTSGTLVLRGLTPN